MPTDAPATPRAIVITGASAGLGAALAISYAAPGCVLGLVARRPELLASFASECEARGASTVTGVFDVQDGDRVAAWLAELDARHPIDLVYVNAGAFTGIGSDGRLEDRDEVRSLIATNLEGAILTANAAAELMRPRRRGHIVLIASLAARQPLADAPVYSATKAGLAAFGEALREQLAPDGIDVTVVLPGHFDTAQTARHHGPLPFLMSATAAAAAIRRRIERRPGHIAFPAALVWLIRLGRCLPWRLRIRASRGFRFTVGSPN